MTSFDPKKPFIIEEDSCVLDKAVYSGDLSVLDLHQPDQVFYASLDKIPYQTPVDVVKKVLEAQGFKLNLENILATLDQSQFSLRVELDQKGGVSKPVANKFSPTFQFKLPNKTSGGELLHQFYQEVSLQAEEASRINNRDPKAQKRLEDLEKELQSLRQANNHLESRVAELTTKLNNTKGSTDLLQSSSEGLPDEVKLGEFVNLRLEDRMAIVRCGRSQVQVEISQLTTPPKIGSACLVAFTGSQVQSILALGATRHKYDIRIGKVQYKNSHTAKLVDSQRQEWRFSPLSDNESQTLARLKRGDGGIIKIFDDHLISIEHVDHIQDFVFTSKVAENDARLQIHEENMRLMEKASRKKTRPKIAGGQ